MKNKLISLVLVLCLALPTFTFVGCKTAPVVPPTGCETSWSYTTPGVLPYVPMAIRAGVAALIVVKPEVKPQIQDACLKAWNVTKNSDLGLALNYILSAIQPFKPYAQTVQVLLDNLLTVISPNLKLTDCDINVWCSLWKNIGVDTGMDPTVFQ